MDCQSGAVYCLCADMRTALHHHDDPQCHLTDAEIITVALVAALFFARNDAHAQRILPDNTPSHQRSVRAASVDASTGARTCF